MNINIEERDNVQEFLPGLFKFLEDGLFSQAILGITEKEIHFYNDHAPSNVSGGTLTYNVRMRLKIEEIDTVLNERIINNADMAGLGRLNFISGEESTVFYYFLDDKKLSKSFIDYLKAYGLPVQNRKVDLNKQ